MTRILIIGGAGFLGGAIVKHYLNNNADGYEITVLDNLTYEDDYLHPVDFIYADIRDRKKLKAIVEKFDVIVLLAAIVGDAACQANPLTTVEINQDFPLWLMENFDGKIIFASTCSVYGSNDDLLNEEGDIKPLSLYAKTKANVECEFLKRKDTIIFRLGTLFGVAIRPRFDLFVNTLTARAVINKHIRVFGGNQWRPNLHVMDAGRWFLNAALNDYKDGVYNLSAFNATIRSVGDIIYEKYPEIIYEVTSSKFEDNRNYKVTTEKAKTMLNFKPELKLENGVDEVAHIINSGRIKNLLGEKYNNALMINKNEEEK